LEYKQNISEIFRSYGNQLKGFIRNRVKNAEDVEDVLQDVFYQLSEADYLMKPIEHISAWLFTVARNRTTDLYRKKKAEPISNSFDEEDEDDFGTEITEILQESGSNPETQYLQSIVWDELEKALDELPAEQRSVFEMHELRGISFREIAKITGETENTLISRKRYAVLHLRERLKTLYAELINF
jgi:RNA polymerase sigma factor (sigma-70 family)